MLDLETHRPPCSGPARWPVLDLSIAAALAAGLAALAAVAWPGAAAETAGQHAPPPLFERRA